MSHRKFSAPRHGSLGYLPRKRSRRKRGRIKAFPKDVPTPGVNEEKWADENGVHLTAFMGYKAGMTHILRNFERQGIRVVTLETNEPVTVIECPTMHVIGMVGYVQTARGLRPLKTVWIRDLNESARRRLTSNWYKSKKNMFRHHRYRYNSVKCQRERAAKIEAIRERCSIIRIIASTQPKKVNIGVKRSHIMEIQVNGGRNMSDKLKFIQEKLLGKLVSVGDIFSQNELIDVLGITRGRGRQGVVGRYHVRCLPRKTHKGLRKVACIGAWHPARVMFSVARAGQKGHFHRVHRNKKIYRMGGPLGTKEGDLGGMTQTDLTEKSINPISGFPGYGFVTNDFIVVKGSVMGPAKGPITLRKVLRPNKSKRMTDEIELKFIDTSSKIGRGRFQTRKEKLEFYGKTKKQRKREFDNKLKKKEEEETEKPQVKEE